MAHKTSFVASLAATAIFASLSATPAFAINGSEAVNQCLQQGARLCAFASQPDGSIRITTRDGHALRCGSANSACEMLYAPRNVNIAEAPRAQARSGR